jgi:hypothetical protein
MRRTARSNLPVSPRLLKHFAAATVPLTIFIAVFADGSTTEAVAHRVEQNALTKVGNDKLASRHYAQRRLLVRKGPPPVADDSAVSDGPPAEGSSWDGPTTAPVYSGGGYQQSVGSVRPDDSLTGGDPKARKAAEPKRLTAAELAAIQEVSRQRTGSASVD